MGSLIRVLDRQGILKGDLNVVQRSGLMWLMNEEVQEQIGLEQYRALNNALGSNPQTSGEYIETLLKDDSVGAEEEIFETADEWTTPEGIEDITALLGHLG